MRDMEEDRLDEILGVTRCVQCGQRLDGEVSCPVCSGFYEDRLSGRLPDWVFFTACFLTSPLSLWVVLRSSRLSTAKKLLASSGILFWAAFFLL